MLDNSKCRSMKHERKETFKVRPKRVAPYHLEVVSRSHSKEGKPKQNLTV